MSAPAGALYRLARADFARLAELLRGQGYATLAPLERQGAIAWDEFSSVDELPQSYDRQAPGSHRLEDGKAAALFPVVHGAQSLKHLTFIPREPLMRIERQERELRFHPQRPEAEKRAVFGVRACDLAALTMQKRILLEGEHADPAFAARTGALFIVAVNCTRSQPTCFCASMGSGPKAGSGFDLAITETGDELLVEAGSGAGEQILEHLGLDAADAAMVDAAAAAITAAAAAQSRKLEKERLPAALKDAHSHPRWDEVASRCLSCANCTMVCPTCFCHTIEETPDLSGEASERVRVWDSCFSPAHGYIHGKNLRPTTRERYRMWLIHKFEHWVAQFGDSGCVGCGRCITWCPVGIDITEEAAALMEAP